MGFLAHKKQANGSSFSHVVAHQPAAQLSAGVLASSQAASSLSFTPLPASQVAGVSKVSVRNPNSEVQGWCPSRQDFPPRIHNRQLPCCSEGSGQGLWGGVFPSGHGEPLGRGSSQ